MNILFPQWCPGPQSAKSTADPSSLLMIKGSNKIGREVRKDQTHATHAQRVGGDHPCPILSLHGLGGSPSPDIPVEDR
jgi:hypothetical protein